MTSVAPRRYLQDAGLELFGLRIWGTPWQPWFYDWAFNAPRHNGEDSSRRSSTRFPPASTSSWRTGRRADTATLRAETSASGPPR
jgi:hypothetical protein